MNCYRKRVRRKLRLVDDEQALLHMAKDMIEGLGYKVMSFADPRKALEAFRAAPTEFDVVMTDHIMPKMTGIQLAADLLEIRPGIAIVLTTGLGDPVTGEQGKRMGIRRFVQKPVNRTTIATAINMALNSRQERPT